MTANLKKANRRFSANQTRLQNTGRALHTTNVKLGQFFYFSAHQLKKMEKKISSNHRETSYPYQLICADFISGIFNRVAMPGVDPTGVTQNLKDEQKLYVHAVCALR